MKNSALTLPHVLKPASRSTMILAAFALMSFIAPHAQAAAASGDIQLFPPSNPSACNSGTALMYDGVHATYCGTPQVAQSSSGTVVIADANGHHYVVPSYVSSSLLDTTSGLGYNNNDPYGGSVVAAVIPVASIQASNPFTVSLNPTTSGNVYNKDTSNYQIVVTYSATSALMSNGDGALSYAGAPMPFYSVVVPASIFNSTTPSVFTAVPSTQLNSAQGCWTSQGPGVFVSSSATPGSPQATAPGYQDCLNTKLVFTPTSITIQKLD
jgi:hypothetical protein